MSKAASVDVSGDGHSGYTYAYAAGVSVTDGVLDSLILPHVNTDCMQIFLDEVAVHVSVSITDWIFYTLVEYSPDTLLLLACTLRCNPYIFGLLLDWHNICKPVLKDFFPIEAV